MRNRPTVTPHRRAVPGKPQMPPAPEAPNFQPESLTPFLVCGGATFYVVTAAPSPVFDPRPAGVQLVTHVYVPFGLVGFCKEIRVAPFMPTVLADPWETSGLQGDPAITSWRTFDAIDGPTVPVRPGGTHGVWTTPFGWESYFDSGACGEQPPQWTWQLRLVSGDVGKQRRAFSVADPASWYLQPNIAVPLAAYDGGIPGASPSGYWGPQRMQVLQGDKLSTHVLVPENTSLCLFTQWTQLTTQPRAVVGETITEYGEDVYPLLPSFGQLHGYLQPAANVVSQENARFGWGG